MTDWLRGKYSTCNTGDGGLIFGLVIAPGVGNGNPVQYSCLSNPMDKRDWQATAHCITKELDMIERLNNSKIYVSVCVYGY